MKYALKMKTPLYMGNEIWLSENMQEEHANIPAFEHKVMEIKRAVLVSNGIILALVCAAAFVWLTFGAAMPAFSSATALSSSPRARYEWAGNRGRALMRFEQTHAITNLK